MRCVGCGRYCTKAKACSAYISQWKRRSEGNLWGGDDAPDNNVAVGNSTLFEETASPPPQPPVISQSRTASSGRLPPFLIYVAQKLKMSHSWMYEDEDADDLQTSNPDSDSSESGMPLALDDEGGLHPDADAFQEVTIGMTDVSEL